MNIRDQAALVTGGASGLGEATARELARLGAKVAVLDVNGALAGKVAADIGGVACECDITNADSVSAALAKASDAHGPARVLMNIAGIGSAKRIVGKDGNAAPLEDFVRVVNVNLIGAYNVSRLFAAACAKLDPLEGGERGVMLFTASVAAFDGQVGQQALQRIEGRARGHDPADGARPRTARHPRLHDRAGVVRDAADEAVARACTGIARGFHPVPEAARQA